MAKVTIRNGSITTTRNRNVGALVFGALAVVLLGWLLLGWLIMTAVGFINQDWAAVPALGYAASLQSVILVYVLGVAWHLAQPSSPRSK